MEDLNPPINNNDDEEDFEEQKIQAEFHQEISLQMSNDRNLLNDQIFNQEIKKLEEKLEEH